MSEFADVIRDIFYLFGDEFLFQLLVTGLLFLGCEKRSLFALRYIGCAVCMIGVEHVLLGIGREIVPWNYLIQACLVIVAVLICYRCDVVQAIFLGLCIYCLQHIVSTVSYSAIYALMLLGVPFDAYYIVMLVVLAIVLPLAYVLLARRVTDLSAWSFGYPSLIYTAVIFWVVAIFLTHYGQAASRASAVANICFRLISCFYALVTLALCFFNRNKKSLEQENTILRLLLEKDKQQYEQAKLNNEKIQVKYHDLKKWESQGILNYPEIAQGGMEGELINFLFFTGNRALDIILTEKAIQCEHAGIRFVCTADGKAIAFMRSYHIYSFIGNALDNAIESLQKLERAEERELVASIVRERDMCLIKVSNRTAAPIVFENGIPKTSKADAQNHGYGIKSMQNVVRFYGGEISFRSEGGLFTVLAVIPLPEEFRKSEE